MTTIINELKKIWTLPSIGILAMVCFIFYTLFLGQNVENFPNGHPSTELVSVATELTQRYGKTLSESEYQAYYDEKKLAYMTEADTYIQNIPALKEEGITDYRTLRSKYNDSLNGEVISEAVIQTWQALISDQTNYLEFRIASIESYLDPYYNVGREHKFDFEKEKDSKPWMKKRIKELEENDAINNIMSTHVFENYSDYLSYMAVLIMMCQFILISPFITRDHMSNILMIQATSKLGRRLIVKQFMAVVITSVLLTSLLGLLFGALFPRGYLIPFLQNQLTSFLNFNGAFFWTDMTFKHYIIVTILIVYCLGLAAALIAFVCSKASKGYMSLIGKILPILALMTFLSHALIYDYRNTANFLYRLTQLIHIENIVWVLMVIISAGLSFYMMKRERHIEY